MTNYEHIKNLSEEDFVKVLTLSDYCSICLNDTNGNGCCNRQCSEGIKDWLHKNYSYKNFQKLFR